MRPFQQAGLKWDCSRRQCFLESAGQSGIAELIRINGKAVPPVNVREPAAKLPWPQRVNSALGMLLSQRIPLGNADSTASLLLPLFRPLFGRVGLTVWAFAVAFSLWTAWLNRQDLGDQVKQMVAPGAWPLLALIGVLVKVVHEAGHAVAAKRKNVRVGNAGITLFLFAPLAYVDLTNSWKLAPRWSRIQIAMGGVYLESWLAMGSLFLFAFADEGMLKHLLAQIIVIAGPATWLTNANPLLRMDGYYALSDLVDIPQSEDARAQSLQWTTRAMVFGASKSSQPLVWLALSVCDRACCFIDGVSGDLDVGHDHCRIQLDLICRHTACRCGRGYLDCDSSAQLVAEALAGVSGGQPRTTTNAPKDDWRFSDHRDDRFGRACYAQSIQSSRTRGGSIS